MEILVEKLYSIIKDHREEEGFMTEERIWNWIEQFEEDDQEFVLEETINIMQKRYISKKDGKLHVKAMIEYLTKKHGKANVKDFIADAYFIDNQGEGKSQKMLLSFLDEILKEEYQTELKECNILTPKYVIYLDDFLCTGDTVVKSLAHEDSGWLNLPNPNGGTNYDQLENSKAELILAYLATHRRATEKIWGRLYYKLDERDITNREIIHNTGFVIENDIENYHNSKLNFLFPSVDMIDEEIEEWQKDLEEKIHHKYNRTEGQNIQFRRKGFPKSEELFSSASNRNRYEKIILKKSMEYYEFNLKGRDSVRPRPLGYGSYSELSFGFGTLIFSWRNVPFNTPLVFWYSYGGKPSLFERVHT